MNAAMLMLVAGSLASPAPTPAIGSLTIRPNVTATFVLERAAVPSARPSASAAAAPEKSMAFMATGGAWVHPGTNLLVGGGATFKPIKTHDQISVAADILLGWAKVVNPIMARASMAEGEFSTKRALFFLISMNVLYELQLKMGAWKPSVGGGIVIDHGSGSTSFNADLKLVWMYLLSSGAYLRPEVRFILASGVPILLLFSYVF